MDFYFSAPNCRNPHTPSFTQVSEQHNSGVQQGSSGAGRLTWAHTDEVGLHSACLRWVGFKLCFSLHLQSCSSKFSPHGYLVLMLLGLTLSHRSWTMFVCCFSKLVQVLETWHRLWFLAITLCLCGFSGKKKPINLAFHRLKYFFLLIIKLPL